MILYIAECLRHYRSAYMEGSIPKADVFEILPSANNIQEIKLGGLKSRGTWFRATQPAYPFDIVNLCILCQIIEPKIVFEIGTMTGYTAFHFALNTPCEAKIYTLDLPRDGSVSLELKTTINDDAEIERYIKRQGYHFDNSDVSVKIHCLFGDSASFDFSPFYGKVDLFFIDGAHSYDYVRSDTHNAFKCCHPGSVIVWHDFGRVGVNRVTRWLTQLSKEGHKIYQTNGGSLAFMPVE